MTRHHLRRSRQTRTSLRHLLLLLALSGTVYAQTPAPPPAPRPTLAAALVGAQPPAQGVALSVDAGGIKLPPDALLPGTAPTVAEIADAYGRTTQRFGSVTAVAPPTMIVLNTAPGEPDPYDGMPPSDALTLLTAGLSDGQWKSLISEQGMGISQLTSDSQRELFRQMLADGKLRVAPWYWRSIVYKPEEVRDLSGELGQAHLRVAQTAQISIGFAGKSGEEDFQIDDVPPDPMGPPRFKLVERQNYGGSSDRVYGALVRAEVPNTAKRGQLDLASPALRAAVPLSGLKTVGDLVLRIGRRAHLEIYPDAHFEALPLTVVGSASAAPGRDMLRALAFCLTGTFRRVGPAFVLTDDVVGLGARKQLWFEFEQRADALRAHTVAEAGEALYARRSAHTLRFFDSPLAYTPDQEKPQPGSAFFQFNTANPESVPTLEQPLSQYSPTQQAAIRRAAAQFSTDYHHQFEQEGLTPPGPQTKVTFYPTQTLQLLVPSVAEPIDMNLTVNLFQIPQDVQQAHMKEIEEKQRQELLKAHPELAARMIAASTPAPPSAVFAALKGTPRRAALVHPRTAKEVDADVAAAQTLGLNEIWLDVFSDGVAHIPGSALSPVQPLPPGAGDVLTEALAKTTGTGIGVFPVMDLLFWGPSPPPQAADRNVLGETSAQAAARWQERKALLPAGQEMQDENTVGGVIPDWPGVAVSPMSPDVQAGLTGLVTLLAARPGVAGLVWRDTDTPGYDIPANGLNTSSLLLGYHEAMRLAYLRKYHADPVDVFPPGYYQGKANTDLPFFRTDSMRGTRIAFGLDKDWTQFRRDAPVGFLRALYAAANPSPDRRVPVLLKQRQRGQGGNDAQGRRVYPPGWYGSWDDPRLPPPTLHSEGEDEKPGEPMQRPPDADTQARQQSRIVLVPITGDELVLMRQSFSLPRAHAYLQSHPMPGFVLDLGPAPVADGKTGTDPLVALAESLQAGDTPAHQGHPAP